MTRGKREDESFSLRSLHQIVSNYNSICAEFDGDPLLVSCIVHEYSSSLTLVSNFRPVSQGDKQIIDKGIVVDYFDIDCISFSEVEHIIIKSDIVGPVDIDAVPIAISNRGAGNLSSLRDRG